MAKKIAVCNQKGGVAKTTTSMMLGVGLANEGKKVLMVDTDPQGDLGSLFGYDNLDAMDNTLSTIINKMCNEETYNIDDYILKDNEGCDLLPSNIELAESQVYLFNQMSREVFLKNILDEVDKKYDYIIIDCQPSLDLMTINSLVAADSVVIPIKPEYLGTKGTYQLFKTIAKARKINRELRVEGVLYTIVNGISTLPKQYIDTTKNIYSELNITAFENSIPQCIDAAKASERGISVYQFDNESNISKAYAKFVKEVLNNDERRKEKTRPIVR